MWGGGIHGAVQRELNSDAYIQLTVPGGLNSPYGRQLDNFYGGNPNPTLGQRYGGYGYGYGYRRPY